MLVKTGSGPSDGVAIEPSHFRWIGLFGVHISGPLSLDCVINERTRTALNPPEHDRLERIGTFMYAEYALSAQFKVDRRQVLERRQSNAV